MVAGIIEPDPITIPGRVVEDCCVRPFMKTTGEVMLTFFIFFFHSRTVLVLYFALCGRGPHLYVFSFHTLSRFILIHRNLGRGKIWKKKKKEKEKSRGKQTDSARHAYPVVRKNMENGDASRQLLYRTADRACRFIWTVIWCVGGVM